MSLSKEDYVMVKLSSQTKKLLEKIAEIVNANIADLCYEILESYEPILKKIAEEHVSNIDEFIEKIYRIPLSSFIIDHIEHEILETLHVHKYYELEEVNVEADENKFLFMFREKETSPYNVGDWFLEFNGKEWTMIFSLILDGIGKAQIRKLSKVKAPFKSTILLSQLKGKNALTVRIVANKFNELPDFNTISGFMKTIRELILAR